MADGTTVETGDNAVNGIFLRYKIDGGFLITYAHLQETLVKEGDAVKRGQIIAKSGNTGQSAGAHLHFTFSLNGEPVNPADYISLPGTP
jgi:murein DD-endopeptidase MepM/ murein hydrolase activator NlpD